MTTIRTAPTAWRERARNSLDAYATGTLARVSIVLQPDEVQHLADRTKNLRDIPSSGPQRELGIVARLLRVHARTALYPARRLKLYEGLRSGEKLTEISTLLLACREEAADA